MKSILTTPVASAITVNPKVLQDITRDAQKPSRLSDSQRYGANYIADISRLACPKNTAARTSQTIHYGIGKTQKNGRSGTATRTIQLLHQDMQYGTLQLTAQAGAVLRGERSVKAFARSLPKRDEYRRHPNSLEAMQMRGCSGHPSTRKELADSKGVPLYVIFTDKTLIAMASEQPRPLDDMGKLHGVGRIKRIMDPYS